MEKLINKINKFQQNVFKYNINDAVGNLQQIVSELEGIIGIVSSDEVKKIHEILEYINSAFHNKDYLLMADLFEYELISCLNNISDEERLN